MLGCWEIEDPPSFGGAVNTEFILAMGKIGNQVIMFLDIDKVLSAEAMQVVGAAASD